MIIDVSECNTFPIEIKEVVIGYIANLSDDVRQKIACNKIERDIDVRCYIEDYMGPYTADALYHDVVAILSRCIIISYHATKILDETDIKRNGLHTNSWDWYSEMLTKSLAQLGVKQDKIEIALDLVNQEYLRKFRNNRDTSQVCFFSNMRLYDMKTESGYSQFCENIGGELARWALEDEMPEVYEKLKNNGKAVVIKVALPFLDIVDYLKDYIAYQFISYYAAQYFWNYKYNIEFDCVSEKNVSSDKVMEVIYV